MIDIYSNVIETSGSYYEMGRQQGEQLIGTPILEAHKQKQEKLRKRFTVDIEEAKRLLLKFAPSLWEELIGLADGLGWSIEETVREYSGYQQDWIKSGCSIFTGDDYFIRNYDFTPEPYDGRFVLSKPDNGYATIGPAQRIIGRADGMNEEGLVIGYNFVNRIKPGDGFICVILTRMVLEYCRTVDEAIDLLYKVPHRTSFNYVIMDRSGRTVVVEGSPRGVAHYEGNYCTNHFDRLTGENRRHMDDSKRRMKDMQGRDPFQSGAEAFRYLNDPEGPIFSEEYDHWAGTIHTIGYFPKTMDVWFTLGGYNRPVPFNLKRWLEGEQNRVKKIRGKLNTTIAPQYIRVEAQS
ncbi:choloylglycine hydrolase [Pontibacillus halophilus JSM 076056 = DSM 19796]|uniref:Choloylglycine hydrolase n=1 Tax=Pontibacillus halophilus JSM 076056 = DSM 19796 TaxID=1385510 RepID=A0A0A5GLE3_9BACI|nr:C45 family peptidase [Pontibacillus halophilus]KGX91975.1 choloylglycine hydrolase [Pontibacillus halophilus JSM 076056 = DSM 19796]